MEKDAGFREIIRRLDVVIYFLLKKDMQEGTSNREIIKQLYGLGLKDVEIAGILGRSRSYVASEISLLKKRRR